MCTRREADPWNIHVVVVESRKPRLSSTGTDRVAGKRETPPHGLSGSVYFMISSYLRAAIRARRSTCVRHGTRVRNDTGSEGRGGTGRWEGVERDRRGGVEGNIGVRSPCPSPGNFFFYIFILCNAYAYAATAPPPIHPSDVLQGLQGEGELQGELRSTRAHHLKARARGKKKKKRNTGSRSNCPSCIPNFINKIDKKCMWNWKKSVRNKDIS